MSAKTPGMFTKVTVLIPFETSHRMAVAHHYGGKVCFSKDGIAAMVQELVDVHMARLMVDYDRQERSS